MSKFFHKKDLTLEKLENFLRKFKGNINSHNGIYGKTPLMIICNKNSSLELIKLMIKYGADVNVTDYSGMNCLFYLFLSKNCVDPKVVEYLMSEGCRIEAFTKRGNNILDIMLIYNSFTKEKLDILLKYRPDIIDKPNVNGKSSLHKMHQTNVKLEIIQTIVEAGADINHLDNNKNNCLFDIRFCTSKRYNQIIKYFVSRGIDINQQNVNGYTLLHIYIMSKKIKYDILKLLISPENINAKNTELETPLTLYLSKTLEPKLKIVKILIDSGADPTIKDRNGVDCLFNLFKNCDKIGIKTVKFLMDKGCTFDQKDSYKNTILHLIAKNPDIQKIKIFKEIGNQFKNEKNSYNSSPLMILSKNYKFISALKAMKMFVEGGYKPSKEEKNICLFNVIQRIHDIDEETEKNINYLIEKGFEVKYDSEKRNRLITPERSTIKTLNFFSKYNFPLGKYGGYISYMKYLNFKCKLKYFSSYQIHY